MTRAEILAGARNPVDRQALIQFLRPFQPVPTSESMWDSVGDTLATLYSHGVSVPFPDATVATVAILYGIEVWARDPHFAMMQKHLPGLKLFVESP